MSHLINSPQPRRAAGASSVGGINTAAAPLNSSNNTNANNNTPRYAHGVKSMSSTPLNGNAMHHGTNTNNTSNASSAVVVVERPLRALTVDEIQLAKKHVPNVYNAVIQYDSLYLNALTKVEGKENELKRCIEVGQEVLTQLQTLRRRCQSLEEENGSLVAEVERLRADREHMEVVANQQRSSSQNFANAEVMLKNELQEALRQNNTLRLETQRLQSELTMATANTASAENKYNKILVLHQQQQQMSLDQQQASSANQHALSALEQQLATATEEMEVFKRTTAMGRDEVDHLSAELRRVQAQLIESHGKAATAQQEAASDKSKVRQLELQVQMLTESLSAVGSGGSAGNTSGGKKAATTTTTGAFETDCAPEDAVDMAATAALCTTMRRLLKEANNATTTTADGAAAPGTATPSVLPATGFKQLRRDVEGLHREVLFAVDRSAATRDNDHRLNTTIQNLLRDNAVLKEDRDAVDAELRQNRNEMTLLQQELQRCQTSLQYNSVMEANGAVLPSRSPSMAGGGNASASAAERERDAKEKGELTALRTITTQLQTELAIARSDNEGLAIQRKSFETEVEAYRTKLIALQQELTEVSTRELTTTERSQTEVAEWRRKAITAEAKLAAAQREAKEATDGMEALLTQQHELFDNLANGGATFTGVAGLARGGSIGSGGAALGHGGAVSSVSASVSALADKNLRMLADNAAAAMAASNQMASELRAKEAELIEKDLRIRQLLDEGAVARRSIGSLIADWVSWRRSLDEQNAMSNVILNQAAAAAAANGGAPKSGGAASAAGAPSSSLVGLIASSPFFAGGSPSMARASSANNNNYGTTTTTSDGAASVLPIIPQRSYAELEQLAYRLKTDAAASTATMDMGGDGADQQLGGGGGGGGAPSGYVTPAMGTTPLKVGGMVSTANRGRSSSVTSVLTTTGGGVGGTVQNPYLSLHRDFLTAMSLLRSVISSQEAEDRELTAAQLRHSSSAANANAVSLSAASERHQRELLNEIAALQRSKQSDDERVAKAEGEIDRLRKALEKFRRDATSMEEALVVASDRDAVVVRALQQDKERLETMLDKVRAEREGESDILRQQSSRQEKQIGVLESSNKTLLQQNGVLQQEISSLMSRIEESTRGNAVLSANALADAEARRVAVQSIVDAAHRDLRAVVSELQAVEQHLGSAVSLQNLSSAAAGGAVFGGISTPSTAAAKFGDLSPNAIRPPSAAAAGMVGTGTSASVTAAVAVNSDRRLATLHQIINAAATSMREVIGVVADRLSPSAVQEQLAAAAHHQRQSSSSRAGSSSNGNGGAFDKYLGGDDDFIARPRSRSQQTASAQQQQHQISSQQFITLSSRIGSLKYVPTQLSQALVDEMAVMTEMLSVRDEQHNRFVEQTKEHQSEMAQMRRQLEAAECEHEQLLLTRRRLEGEVHELRTSLNDANNKLHDVSHTATEDAAEKNRLKRRLDHFQEELETQRRDHQDELSLLKTKYDALKSSSDAERSAKNSTEAATFDELERARTHISKLNSQIATLKNQQIGVSSDYDALTQKERVLNTQLRDREEKLERCTAMLVTAKAEIDRINTDLIAAKEQQSRDKQHSAKGKEEIAVIMRQAQERIVDLQDSLQSVGADRDAAKSRVADLTAQLNELRTNGAATGRRRVLQKSGRVLSGGLRPAGGDAETSDEDGEGFITILKYFRLKAQFTGAQRVLEDMGRQFEAERQHSKALQAEVQSCLAKLRQLKDDYVTIQTHNEALAASNSSLERRLALVEADRDPLRERLHDAILAEGGGSGNGGSGSGHNHHNHLYQNHNHHSQGRNRSPARPVVVSTTSTTTNTSSSYTFANNNNNSAAVAPPNVSSINRTGGGGGVTSTSSVMMVPRGEGGSLSATPHHDMTNAAIASRSAVRNAVLASSYDTATYAPVAGGGGHTPRGSNTNAHEYRRGSQQQYVDPSANTVAPNPPLPPPSTRGNSERRNSQRSSSGRPTYFEEF